MTPFPPTLFAGKRYFVAGLGRNGSAVARRLLAMGAEVAVWDDNAAAREAVPDLPAQDPANGIGMVDALILSPGIPHHLPKPHIAAVHAKAAGIPILSDSELLFQAVRLAGSRARFAGITGTNGKSTTTALLAHILETAGVPVAAGGNLGIPALALPLLPDNGVYVLEMSSYMLERLQTLRFDAACLLNLSPDHLDRHGNMAGYRAAKMHIFDRQTGADTAIYGEELAGTGEALPPMPALPGGHNAQNAAAARAMARALGVAETAIATGLQTFPGLPHRLQTIATINGVTYVNDSKATNADAAARALACYEGVIWLAGGIAKAGGIESLAPYFPRVSHAILFGRDRAQFAATLARHNVPHTLTETLADAMAETRKHRAQTVLLSPAAASFDQFSGFEARGDRFAELVAHQIPVIARRASDEAAHLGNAQEDGLLRCARNDGSNVTNQSGRNP
jgi:UDP-N-acetylmuramoylalanine--D-glutamate ligase